MKKSYSFDELSDKKCAHPKCSKKIKQRLVGKNDLCYKHFCEKEAKRGHTINTRPRQKRILSGLDVKSYK